MAPFTSKPTTDGGSRFAPIRTADEAATDWRRIQSAETDPERRVFALSRLLRRVELHAPGAGTKRGIFQELVKEGAAEDLLSIASEKVEALPTMPRGNVAQEPALSALQLLLERNPGACQELGQQAPEAIARLLQAALGTLPTTSEAFRRSGGNYDAPLRWATKNTLQLATPLSIELAFAIVCSVLAVSPEAQEAARRQIELTRLVGLLPNLPTPSIICSSAPLEGEQVEEAPEHGEEEENDNQDGTLEAMLATAAAAYGGDIVDPTEVSTCAPSSSSPPGEMNPDFLLDQNAEARAGTDDYGTVLEDDGAQLEGASVTPARISWLQEVAVEILSYMAMPRKPRSSAKEENPRDPSVLENSEEAVELLLSELRLEERLLALLDDDRVKERPEFGFRVSLLLVHIVSAARMDRGGAPGVNSRRSTPRWASYAASSATTLGDNATLETLLARGFLEQLGEAAQAAAAGQEWPAGSSCFPLLWKLSVTFREIAEAQLVSSERLGESTVLQVLAETAARSHDSCSEAELFLYKEALAAFLRVAFVDDSAGVAARAKVHALLEAASGDSYEESLILEELRSSIDEDAGILAH